MPSPPLQKLIVALGETGVPFSRPTVGLCIVDALLWHCGPAPADVCDPSRPDGRSRSRDHRGRDRPDGRGWAWVGGRAASRRLMEWDTLPFVDVGGRWCDRLLLGGPPPVRAAVLGPQLPLEVCVERVYAAFSQFDAVDTLLLAPTVRGAWGGMRVGLLRDGPPTFAEERNVEGGESDADVNDTALQRALESYRAATTRMLGEEAADYASVLWVGIGGSSVPENGAVEIDDESRIETEIAPRGAFIAALWCTNPRDAAACARARHSGQPRKSWAALQSSMPSYRDEAVMQAYREGRAVDQRMRWIETCAAASNIIERRRLR